MMGPPATPRSMAKNLQTVARRALTPCAGSDAFRFADGTSCRELADLRHALSMKSATLVAHHRADYAPWIETVLGDPALSRRIGRIAGKRALDGDDLRREMLVVLDERIGKLRTRVV